VAAYYPAEPRNIFASSRGRYSKATRLLLSRRFVARLASIVTILAIGCILCFIIKLLYIVEFTTIM
jgi:hypothetical protein